MPVRERNAKLEMKTENLCHTYKQFAPKLNMRESFYLYTVVVVWPKVGFLPVIALLFSTKWQ